MIIKMKNRILSKQIFIRFIFGMFIAVILLLIVQWVAIFLLYDASVATAITMLLCSIVPYLFLCLWICILLTRWFIKHLKRIFGKESINGK